MQYFNNIQNELIKAINNSDSSLKIAVTWFTNNNIYDVIVNKIKTNKEFKLELIVLNDRINNKIEGVNFQNLINLGCEFYFSNVEKMVHHKFCIIDDKLIITGSYNWTYYAENRNWENIIFLDDKKIANGYIEEFNKLKQSHKKIENVSEEILENVSINQYDYLNTDYILQAKNEELKGNDLNVAKIYTEILKLNSKQQNIVEARNIIVNRYNLQQFEISPFEIGILFANGYSLAIPAFTKLPFSIKKNGLNPTDGTTSLSLTIQKNDYIKKTILKFSMKNLKPSKAGTPKIEINLTLTQNGDLIVICNEIGGYSRKAHERINIKNCTK